MMLAGELDAAIHYRGHGSIVNRSNVDLRAHPDIRTLFPDVRAEGVRYLQKTGIFPINHGMVIRREIVERDPWVVINLMKAFETANEIADRERVEHVEYHFDAGLISAEARDALKTQVVRHGILANRKTLETAARMSLEQGLTSRLMKLEDVFAEQSLEL
jgi:4,5-dihydroxyphthalate decarboxylase